MDRAEGRVITVKKPKGGGTLGSFEGMHSIGEYLPPTRDGAQRMEAVWEDVPS